MKFLVLAVVLGVACAATREKRGIFGEPGGLLSGAHLHHDSLLGTHAHLPALDHAPVLHAPLRTHVHTAPLVSHVHAAPLHSHIHAAPLLSAAPVLHHHTPVLHHHAPVLHAPLHAPLTSHLSLSSGLHHHDIHDHQLLHEASRHSLHPPTLLSSHHHHIPHYHSAPTIHISRPIKSW